MPYRPSYLTTSLPLVVSGLRFHGMQVTALTSSRLPRETLDLFLTRDAAEDELREILQDEPEWTNVLRVVPIELDGRNVSAN
jgi:hypothetical protein